MIGKVIVSLLKTNNDLTALVPESSVYPYVITENTPLPAIIYTIDNMVPGYSKDGWVSDEISFSIISFSVDYAVLQDIIMQVRKALELEDGKFDDITIKRVHMTGFQEGFNLNEKAFMNKLSFIVEMNSY